MAIAGGAGIGVVLGWVAGQIIARTQRPAVAVLAASLALVLASAVLALLASPDGAAGFAPALLLSSALSIFFRRWLEARAVRGW